MAPDAGDSGLFLRVPAWDRLEGDQPSFWHRLEWWLRGVERDPVPSFLGLIEDPDPVNKPTGVCCSGGGIRSAAFNLGALQRLQSVNRLQDAKYVAAVSGGSYIAAAFAMVAKTRPPDKPDSDDSDPDLMSERPPFYRASPEEQYLRNRSSYMAPAGTGRARVVLRIALGLLINLLFFASLLVVAAWLLTLYYRAGHDGLFRRRGDVQPELHQWAFLCAGPLAALAIGFGLASVFLRSRWDRGRQALEGLSLCALAAAAAVLVIEVGLPELVAFLRDQGAGRSQDQVAGAGGGLAAAAGGGFGGLLAAVLLELRGVLSSRQVKQGAAWYRKLSAGMRRLVAQLAAWIVGPLLLAGVFLLALMVFISAHRITPVAVVVPALLFLWFWFFGDVTSWSLHPFYRRRLCTAFALKRVRRDPGDSFGQAIERDYRFPVRLSESGVEPGPGRPMKSWPTLIVCAAANVSDSGATPPGRGVTSFTFSPVAMGGPLVGGVPTLAFEKCLTDARSRDMTLAAAVAMSGAAVSPSMGKETRRAFRFLLGLANVRLGVWVPNPRRVKRWMKTSEEEEGTLTNWLEEGAHGEQPVDSKRVLFRRPGPAYLIKEMLGRNSVNDPYLYVTDGGHYENLGLVELLRRGCHEIFCFDASGGTSLSALGDAIALARSELQVEIDIDPSALKENPCSRLAAKSCVRGEITYPGGQRGVLIYARSVVTSSAPFDVQAFRENDKAFPHHSTLDQLYTDQKFEAYRQLGDHVAAAALEEAALAEAALEPVTA